MRSRVGFSSLALLVGIALATMIGPTCSREDTSQEQKMEAQPAPEVVQEWVCECCPEVTSDEPGRCPECNMMLTPAEPKEVMPEEGNGDQHGMPGHDQHDGSMGADEWTCGMHPAIRSEEPGKCPICNMDLVPVTAEDTELVRIEPESLEMVGARHGEVQYLPLVNTIRTSGMIEYDERKMRHVASRINGRVERLFADFLGTRVSKGEPLLSIYSPELLTTLAEYRAAVNAAEQAASSGGGGSGSGMKSLAQAAHERLRLWGLDDREIEEAVRDTGADTYELLIRSPMAGTVIEKNVHEGKYVTEGGDLYIVADLSLVWLIADIYEDDIGDLMTGDMVTARTRAWPDEVFHGKIAFIDPYIDKKTRAVRVRMEIHNPDQKLKPGMYIEARLDIPMSRDETARWICPMHPAVVEAHPGECPDCGMFLEKVPGGYVLAVPADAVVHAADIPVVYVERSEGAYEPRQITIGAASQVSGLGGTRYYPVYDGLAAGERVITDASFLIHSQARLTGTAASAYGGALEVEAPGHRH